MDKSKYFYQSSSVSTPVSNQENATNGPKFADSPDYEYVGRLVTRERPIIKKTNLVEKQHVFPRNQNKFRHINTSKSHHIYEEVPVSSSDGESSDGLDKPLGIIKINDRHIREIYRLPTPPPKVKRVYHRLKSPEPKVIERVFVRRPPPQIIENVIEIPPEKVRIINREKYLGESEPITRSKIVKLKPRHHESDEGEEDQQQQQQEEEPQQCYVPSEQYYEQPQTVLLSTPYQTSDGTGLVYPPQANMRTVGYLESTVPPDVMFQSQNPVQIPSNQVFNDATIQPSRYSFGSYQPSAHQVVHSTPNSYALQQPSPYNYPSQQPPSFNYASRPSPMHQVVQPSPYNYVPQQSALQQKYQPSPYYYGSR